MTKSNAIMSTLVQRSSTMPFASAGDAPPWSRFLQRLLRSTGPARARAALWSLKGGRRRQPVFRITRASPTRWIVVRPRATIEHAFTTLTDAVNFIRHEAGLAPATVELYIGDLYVAAYYDPDRPSSLFGEAV
jgi:hypothetical protein